MNRSHQPTDSGSVTAEFAIVLPAIIMVLSIALGSIAIQMERIRMVSVAAGLSRAAARGEPLEKVLEIYSDSLRGMDLRWVEDGNRVCADLSVSVELPGLDGFPLGIGDRECARKLGM